MLWHSILSYSTNCENDDLLSGCEVDNPANVVPDEAGERSTDEEEFAEFVLASAFDDTNTEHLN